MVQQGGLGRGLASLIPQKNKITSVVNKSGKTGGKNKNVNGNKNTKDRKAKILNSSTVGEANYFGGGVFGRKTFDAKINTGIVGKKNIIKKNNIKNKSKDGRKSVLGDITLKSVMEVDVEEIIPNPYQPRTNFDSTKLQELADSIVEHGIIQPLVVSHRKAGGYELIAGERRLEAAKLAGLSKVPVVTRQATEQNKAEWALIENIQRHNLNPIEEAQAYERMRKEFQLTQEEIARKVGKSRSAVANILRLLKLPEEIKVALATGKITEGHGRTILALSDGKKQLDLFKSILKDGLNVRQVERLTGKEKISKNYRRQKNIDPDLIDLENKIAEYLKTKVKIRGIKNNGQILIDYYSEEELGGIAKRLRGE
jgi:ParB family chromosome partitioning protein